MGLLGRTFADDEGAVRSGSGGLLGPMTGAQKAAMLFAGLRDAVGNFSGRPTENLNTLAEQYGQQNYRQQVRQDRLDDKDATRKAEQDRREWELKNRAPNLQTGINPDTKQMGQYYMDPETRLPVWVKGVQLPAPKQNERKYRSGNVDITEVQDPVTGEWKRLASGAAFKPDAPDKGSWLAPVDETGPGGKPIRVRYNTNGERQVITGAMPKVDLQASAPNVDQAKNRQLYVNALKQLPVAEANYDDLAGVGNQSARTAAGLYNNVTFGLAGDPSNTVTSQKGRMAANAIKDIAINYTYSVSGATAPPKEVQDKIDLVMPSITDSDETIKTKKERLREWVNTIQMRGGYSSASPAPPMPKPFQYPSPQQQAAPAAPRQDKPAAAAKMQGRNRRWNPVKGTFE